MISRPLYMNQLLSFVDTPLIKILTGIRRCGKSTLLLMLAEELKNRGVKENNIIHLNFDSLKYDFIQNYKDLYKYITDKLVSKDKYYIFLDEVQQINEWEKAVNSLMIDSNVDIYVTGSNSHMLSSEISTYLTGRYIQLDVFPLSFEEYLTFKASYATPGSPRDELLKYIKIGGFPVLHLQSHSQEESYTIVKDIYNSTLFRDIVERNKLRKIDLLERIVKFSFDNVGKTFSAKSISDYFKSQMRTVDIETVYNYLSLLEKAFILYRCPRYDLQGKEILKTQEKFYLADPALKYCVLGYQPSSVAAMLENIVFLELKRRGYDVFVGKLENKEIDFVASRENDKIYIQVCKEITSEETALREYDVLSSIKDNYPKFLIRTDIFAEGNKNGIIVMHLADFLLTKML